MSTAVVVNAAIPMTGVEQLLARRLVATLVEADPRAVTILAAVPAGGAAWELGLEAQEFLATPARPLRARALADVLYPHLDRCRCEHFATPGEAPFLEAAFLEARGGASPALVTHLEQGGYESVVFVGLRSAPTIDGARAVKGSSRTALLPLAPAPLTTTPAMAEVARGVGRVLVLEEHEAAAFEAIGARAATIGFALRVDDGALDGAPRGLPDRPYVVLLAPWDEPELGPTWRREAARLARVLPDVATVVLTERFIYPDDWPAELEVRAGGSRADVWRWMKGAVAVIDLDPDPYLGRDSLEAALCGTPTLVPPATLAAVHADATGGGLPVRNAADIRAAVAHLRDPDARAALGAQGRAGVTARYTDLDRYRSAVLEAVGAADDGGR